MIYIALLRGINVGGKNMIKMADLVKSFEALGFSNVKTYVQSGNVIFHYDCTDMLILRTMMEDKICQSFGLSIKVILRTYDELINIIKNNPFVKEQNMELDKLYVTLLSEKVDHDKITSLDMNKEENAEYVFISDEIYLYCPNGYAQTKLNNNVFEKKLKVSATTRNWKTMNRLLELSELEKHRTFSS